MKMKFFAIALALFAAGSAHAQKDNTLTAAEKKEGYQLLFNGTSKDGWRMYQNKPSNSWVAENGTLHCLGNAVDKTDKRGNLITNNKYENFDLSIDWKLTPKGNSGILYMVTEEFKEPYLSGPEYQLIDDKNFPEKLENWQTTGANYAMDPPTSYPAHAIGEWNHTRIVVNKGHVQHWLNGVKVVEYDLWTDTWKKHKAEGKWKDAEGYGKSKSGHICLQDHGSEIWFKNIKLKKL
jgi:Domain of Unknown Function (DUF1080)